MADKTWLEQNVFNGEGGELPPMPQELIDLYTGPDDQVLYESILDIIETAVAAGINTRGAAGIIALGVLDLGFHR